MLSIGALIWVSVRPLLRLVICTSFGFIITKTDIFPLVAARGAGQIMLNIALPSLMFSKIVPAFTPNNVGALGPLMLVGILYQIIGIGIAWFVKQFFWVPHRFRYGILVAGGWGNYGDIPTSVLLSLTGNAPFNGTSDQNLSVAYLSAFLLLFFITLFPLGGHRLVALDYAGPEVEDDDLRMSMIAKAKQSIRQWQAACCLLRRKASNTQGNEDVLDVESNYKQAEVRTKLKASGTNSEPTSTISLVENGITVSPQQFSQRTTKATAISKHVSFQPDDSTVVPTEAATSRECSRAVSPITLDILEDSKSEVDNPSRAVGRVSCTTPSKAPLLRIFSHIRTAIMSLMTPPALSIILAFPIALINPLKALFTPVPNSPIPNAPDGQPPLAFILDTATFIGGASVPLGLICLGSALARLKVPRNQWRSLPLGAIAWLAIGKMILTPVLGVLITQGLVSSGVIDREDKVLRLVCIFISCVPTATTQVFLTQVYSGTGSADVLSAFLIPQYTLMFVTMTTLTAYTLSLLF